MTKQGRIEEAIIADKELMKKLKSEDVDIADFIRHAVRYIKAIKQGRMMCKIHSVSKSGMSRTFRFFEMDGRKGQFRVYNFWLFFKMMGFSEARNNRDCFTIGGCGMDMIFHTNYTIIRRLHRLKFINKSECESLEQGTPVVV